MRNVTTNQQPRECGACVTVWAITCSIHPCKVVILFSCFHRFLFLFVLHRLLLVNGFCFCDIMHLSIAAPGNPLDFDTFNFSGVFRIVTSCLCLCVALAFAAQEMKKNIRNIEISKYQEIGENRFLRFAFWMNQMLWH